MGAHPDDTWCKSVGADDDKRYENWLEEANMLPAVTPNARIMRYGYDSRWFGDGSIKTKASNISQKLLLVLKLRREVSTLT